MADEIPVMSSKAEPPHDFANVPPPKDLYPTSDIRFVLVELGKLTEKIDNLSKSFENFGTK